MHADLSLRKVLVEREDSIRLCDLGLSLKTASAPTLLRGVSPPHIYTALYFHVDLVSPVRSYSAAYRW